MENRFNMNARTFDEAVEYYKNRALQLLRFNIHLSSITNMGEYAIAYFHDVNEEYVSYYVFEQHRGKGVYKNLIPHIDKRVLIGDECQLREFLTKFHVDFREAELCPFMEYIHIRKYYGYGKAKRSGVPFMNHIDEGLSILEWIFPEDEVAKRAYVLHPLFQTDDALKDLLNSGIGGWKLNHEVAMAAMEYRSVANEYLSRRMIADVSEIRTSPMHAVNKMLFADKVQNYKDFQLYHQDTHERSAELTQYFKNWLQRLHITDDMYEGLKRRLIITPTIYG